MRKFALWILRKFCNEEPFLVPVDLEGLVASAFVHVSEFEKIPGVSGEWRRHQVYSLMCKKYPERPKKDIGLAIELALRKL